MRKGTTELVFILDRSGSMCGLESDTIGGFNSMIKKQKAQIGEAKVTTVLFDHSYQLLHDRLLIEHIAPMTEKEYYVAGSTALLDAIGSTIQKICNVQKHLPRAERAEKVIFVIITDGMENSSLEFSYKKVKKMIERQKYRYGWEFMFLGANIDAVQEAARFGVSADRAVTYACDSKGVQLNYDVVSQTICDMRATCNMGSIGAEWKEKIEEDCRRRGI